MRFENAAPGTRLLVVLATLALSSWLVALSGIGSYPPPAPRDAGSPEPSPASEQDVPQRLGSIEAYAGIASRPLFAYDRRPHPFLLDVREAHQADRDFDYVLTSILLSPGLQLAILRSADGERSVRVRLNEPLEAHPDWRLVRLEERAAVFAGPGGERRLDLKIFDGVGRMSSPSAMSAIGESAQSPPPTDSGVPEQVASKEEQVQTLHRRIQERREALRREAAQDAPRGN